MSDERAAMNDVRWDRVELERIMSTDQISEGVLFGRVVAGLRGVSVSAHEGEVGGCVDTGTRQVRSDA